MKMDDVENRLADKLASELEHPLSHRATGRRLTPPFRADHVGSLLRPKSLLAARAEHEAGGLSAQQLRDAEDDAIRDAVALQEEVGLRSITDGELRRGSWHMDFI